MDPVSLAILGGTTIANLFGAKNAADASKEAARIQAASADKALAQNERFWNETQQNQAPWLNAGTGAIASLANLMGVPMLSPSQVAPRAQTSPATPPPPQRSPLAAWGRGQSLGEQLRARMEAPSPMLASAGGSKTAAASANSRASSFVKLQSPDGTETMDVPADQVAHYESRGARRVA